MSNPQTTIEPVSGEVWVDAKGDCHASIKAKTTHLTDGKAPDDKALSSNRASETTPPHIFVVWGKTFVFPTLRQFWAMFAVQWHIHKLNKLLSKYTERP